MTVEQQVADTILQKPREIIIGDKKFIQPKPTFATIIEASAIVSSFPKMKDEIDYEELFNDVMRNAKYAKMVGRLLAVLILGVKKPSLITRLIHDRKIKKLSDYILLNVSPKEYATKISEATEGIEVVSFFQIMLFLNRINHTKPTKETKPTPPGDKL